ncbi:MAG: NADH-quinone oxidoreductase subunit L, partial [Acidobacteria bacterium]|nr:NADH-quinone oxidoreductase subunit L [Acidobacteriota bacterium]
FSKDEILWSAYANGHTIVWIIGLLTAGLTAFYMFRLVFLTFYGKPRYSEATAHHLHESPPSMTVPLVILAILSVIGGFAGLPAWMGANRFAHFLEPSLVHSLHGEHAHHSLSLEIGFAALSVAVACLGIFIAYRIYIQRPERAEALAARFRGLHRLLLRKYYVDEMYDAAIINPAKRASTDVLWKGFDVGLIDGIVNGSGRSIQGLASVLKGIQNGLIRNYAVWILMGAVAVLFYISVLRG